MPLVRYRLRPTSPWLTPWHADTLAGLLCCVHARRHGREAMYDRIQQPALAGEPPFILSDALPGDLLPLPVTVRLLPWTPDERKRVKRTRFLTREAFEKARLSHPLALADLRHGAPFLEHGRWRNTLSRTSNTTGDDGNLFSSTETSLRVENFRDDYLSVYARVAEGWVGDLTALFEELSETGFGADARVGRGQFDLLGQPEDASWLDSGNVATGGCVSLSTFQPGEADPTAGYWESFVKYGRLAPDFGIEDVFKRPLLMLRGGATFATNQAVRRLGRVIPMNELLESVVAGTLQRGRYQIAHFAYGLAVPFPAPSQCV